ncbi:MAG: sulfatase [Candidatus Eisenbacteria bacterium]
MKSRNPAVRSVALALVDALGLALLLAFLEVLLHSGVRELVRPPLVEGGRTLGWLTLAYALAVFPLSLAVRSRAALAAVVVLGATVLQGGLLFYRAPAGTDRAGVLLPLAGLVAAVALLWLLHRLLKRSRVLLRTNRLLAAGAAALILISFAAPLPRPEAPGEWPPAPAGGTAGDSSPPNLLLITLDTVRADRLPSYGYRQSRTPNLDRLAREGVVFRRAVAQSSLTPVSHASILTGVYPIRHAVRTFGQSRVVSQIPLLSEILQRQGWLTGAIIASGALDARFGLSRGFDVYHLVRAPRKYPFMRAFRGLLPQVLSRAGLVKDRSLYRRCREITDDGLRWLDKYGSRPFFLWVHYFDAHDPYLPEVASRRPGRHPGTRWSDRFKMWFAYDSEIVGVDEQIGRLLDALSAKNSLDHTVVVAVSDHGEGLGDHSYLGHTRRLYQEQVHIPMIVRYPERLPPGSEVDSQVLSVDILPSLLELFEIEPPPLLDGRSFLPLIGTGRAPDRVAFSETLQPSDSTAKLLAVSDGRYKLIRSLSGETASVFDLQEDPGERHDIAAERPDLAVRLGELLDRYLKIDAPAGSRPEQGAITDEQKEELRALGYLED